MKRGERMEFIKSLVENSPDGISLDHLHIKCSRILTRSKLHSTLSFMYLNRLISKEKVKVHNKKEPRYFPYNGTTPVKRKKKVKEENDGQMLTMKDFMPGRKYQQFLNH